MTRSELLHLLLGHARNNGFEFRKWYVRSLGLPWEGSRHAIELLSENRRYYALLFSHTFAESFWKSGRQITMQVAQQSFQRRMADGSIGLVQRKAFTKRLTRPDAWRYHLREMATSDEPLRYMRRFLLVEEDLDTEATAPSTALDNASGTLDPRFIIDEEDLLQDE